MARAKEFDRDDVLRAAIRVFADRGYEGSSTDTLLKAMNISRQSLYDTFGDKRALYLESLNRYSGDSIGEIIRAANSEADPIAGIDAALMSFISKPTDELTLGCLGIGSVCKFGTANEDVNRANEFATKALQASF